MEEVVPTERGLSVLQPIEECPICLQPLSSVPNPSQSLNGFRQIFLTNCQHQFCNSCITKHLKLRKDCPIFRQTIKTLSIFDNKHKISCTLVLIRLKYGKQIYECQVKANCSFGAFKDVICKFLQLSPENLKIIHKGTLITKDNFREDLLKPDNKFQVMGIPLPVTQAEPSSCVIS